MPTSQVIAAELGHLTAESLSGVGIFDTLMRTTKLHLQEEYDAQRITGNEYATVYLGALNVVLQTSAQFIMNVQQAQLIEAQINQINSAILDTTNVILNRNAAQAVNEADSNAKIAAMQAQTTNENTRTVNDTTRATSEGLKRAAEVTAMQAQTLNENARTANDNTRTASEIEKIAAEIAAVEANTVNSTNKIASEITSMEGALANDTTRTGNDTAKADAEIASIEARTSNETLKISEEITASQGRTINETNKISAEISLLETQAANDTTRTNNDSTRASNESSKVTTENSTLTSRTAAEVKLLDQKTATELANTSDTIPTTLGVNATGTERKVFDKTTPDNSVGVLGRQQTLYKAQADGFARDAEQKLTKIMADTWSIQASVANSAMTPEAAGFAEYQLLAVINKARAGIGVTPDLTYTPPAP
jgi:hypothetical protein